MPGMKNSENLSYKDAGVDIEAGEKLADDISRIAAGTAIPGVVSGIGGFASIFDLKAAGFTDPLLVAATDGVGTKLQLAEQAGTLDTVGIDLVAMCANDVLATGATPLFFLDYLACGKIHHKLATKIVKGIAGGCKLAGMALVGGESAEMPGLYPEGSHDLAGFCVGAVERNMVVDGKNIEPGDSVIALASDGVHSNGYSLVRKILQEQGIDQSRPENWPPQICDLMLPTRIYVQPVLPLLKDGLVRGIAHITGGGLPGNIPRILPAGTRAVLNKNSWQWPEPFLWLQQHGNITGEEMLRTFNCGIGLVLVTPASQQDTVIARLTEAGENAWKLGSIEQGEPSVIW